MGAVLNRLPYNREPAAPTMQAHAARHVAALVTGPSPTAP
jgi:hypothetical protein